jgi:hypothetical protein
MCDIATSVISQQLSIPGLTQWINKITCQLHGYVMAAMFTGMMHVHVQYTKMFCTGNVQYCTPEQVLQLHKVRGQLDKRKRESSFVVLERRSIHKSYPRSHNHTVHAFFKEDCCNAGTVENTRTLQRHVLSNIVNKQHTYMWGQVMYYTTCTHVGSRAVKQKEKRRSFVHLKWSFIHEWCPRSQNHTCFSYGGLL